MIVVGEKSEPPGPAPFLVSMVGGTWGVESVPYAVQSLLAADRNTEA